MLWTLNPSTCGPVLLLLAGSTPAEAGSHVYFGLYDFEENPGGGWQLMSAADFEDYRLKFIAAYNHGVQQRKLQPDASEQGSLLARMCSGQVALCRVWRALASLLAVHSWRCLRTCAFH